MTSRLSSWTALIAACLAVFLPGSMIFGFPAVLSPYWQSTFGTGRADVGQVLFYILAGAGSFMFLIGRLQERLGPVRVIFLGSLVGGAGMVMIAYINGISWIYVWGFINGASSAFAYLPALTVVQRWFPARRGLVTGLVSISFGIAGRLVSGFLSDRMGRRRIMGISFLLAGVACFIFPVISGLAIWMFYAAVIGFSFGTLNAVTAPLVSDCFGVQNFGTIFGMVFTAFGFVSGAIGPWLVGYMLDVSQNNFTLVFIYLGSLLTAATLMIWLTSPQTECTM